MDGNWKEVTSGRRKERSGKLSKTEKKKLAENMPKIDLQYAATKIGSVYSPTMANNEIVGGIQQNGITNGGDGNRKKSDKSERSDKKTHPKKSVKDTLKQIDGADIREKFSMLQKNYPKNQTLWFAETASQIQLLFDSQGDKDPTYQSESYEYPLNQLSTEAVKKLKHLPTCASAATLDDFLQLAAEKIAEGVSKNQTTFGWRIMGQLVAKYRPEAVLSHRDKLNELLARERSNNARFLSAAWCAMQAGYASPHDVGFRVLVDYLMPFVHHKGLAPAIVSYAEFVFSAPGAETVCRRHEDFFPLLDVCLGCTDLGLPNNLTKRLFVIYTAVRRQGLEAADNDKLKHYFPGFLIRLRPPGKSGKPTAPTSAIMEIELLSALVECITRAPDVCCSLWRDLHASGEATAASSALLLRLDKEWSQLMKKKGVMQHVRETLMFIVECADTEDIVSPEATSAAGAAKELLLRLEQSVAAGGVLQRGVRFTRRLTLVLLGLLFLLVVIDLHFTRWDWSSTKSARFLQRSGLREGVARVQLTLEPTVQWIWVKGVQPASVSVSKFMSPYLHELHDNWEPVLRDTWTKLRSAIEENWPILVDWAAQISDIIWNFAIQVIYSISHCLQTAIAYLRNFSFDLSFLRKSAVTVVEAVVDSIAKLFEYLLQIFNQGSTST